MNTARGIVFGYGIGATVAVSFIYITLLRSQCLAKTFIWGAMLAMLVCLAVFCGLAYQTANTWEQSNPKSHSNDEIVGLRVVSAVLLALGLLWALFMLFSCSAINLAIKLMSLTAECIEEMPLILLTPIIKTAGIVAFLVCTQSNFITSLKQLESNHFYAAIFLILCHKIRNNCFMRRCLG